MSSHDKDRASGHNVPLKFEGVVLVCGDCEERSSGPKKLRARDARRAMKIGLGDARFKVRVVQSTCLGLCPKKAMAIAALGPHAPPLGAEVKREDEVSAFAAQAASYFRGRA